VEKLGNIEIRIVGNVGAEKLSPQNYDIKHLANLLQDVEDLLYPNNKKERPLITYDISEGSVRHIFKTSMQTVIGFTAILAQINTNNSIDFLELKTARAFENIQNNSIQKNYEFQIKTSLQENYELQISPKTKFYRSENIWLDAEFYLYGTLKNAGGKNKANIHLDTNEYGYLIIETGEDFLKSQEKNLLYRKFGVRANGKQHIETGEMDTKSLKLIELIDYNPKFDNDYLKSLISNAKKNWQGIDADDWLQSIRGDYEA
jgi:hypothetical protein